MEDSPVLNSAKRKDLEDIALEDGAGSHKRLKRQLTQETDLKVREFPSSVATCSTAPFYTLQSRGSGGRAGELKNQAPHAGHCRGFSWSCGLRLVLGD